MAPPYVHLKNQFSSIGIGFVDIPGTWKISISIGPGYLKECRRSYIFIGDGSANDKVTVVHSKGAKSSDTSSRGYFEFVWELYMEFDRGYVYMDVILNRYRVQNMTRAYLSIPILEFSEEFSKERRKEILRVLNAYEHKESPNDFELQFEYYQKDRSRRITRGFHEVIRVGTQGERSKWL